MVWKQLWGARVPTSSSSSTLGEEGQGSSVPATASLKEPE